MNEKLTTLYKFNNTAEANIVKSILEENNIYCVLLDENLSTIDPHLTDAIGLIKLQVRESELNESISILKEHNFDTEKIKVHVFEAITTENETCFEGTVKDLEGKEFSDLSVMVFNQTSLDSYMNYRW